MRLLSFPRKWVLVLPVMISLTGCLYPNSSRTDVEIGGIDANEPQEVAQFFKDYENLLDNMGFSSRKSFSDDGSVLMRMQTERNLLTCRGAMVDDLVRIKCLEIWSPWIPFLWPRVSVEYVQLMKNVALFIEPFGVTKVERYLYNGDYREMDLSDLIAGR